MDSQAPHRLLFFILTLLLCLCHGIQSQETDTIAISDCINNVALRGKHPLAERWTTLTFNYDNEKRDFVSVYETLENHSDSSENNTPLIKIHNKNSFSNYIEIAFKGEYPEGHFGMLSIIEEDISENAKPINIILTHLKEEANTGDITRLRSHTSENKKYWLIELKNLSGYTLYGIDPENRCYTLAPADIFNYYLFHKGEEVFLYTYSYPFGENESRLKQLYLLNNGYKLHYKTIYQCD